MLHTNGPAAVLTRNLWRISTRDSLKNAGGRDFERVTALRKFSPRLNPVPPGRVRDGEPGWEPRGSLSGKKGRLVRRNRRAEVCRYPIAHRGD